MTKTAKNKPTESDKSAFLIDILPTSRLSLSSMYMHEGLVIFGKSRNMSGMASIAIEEMKTLTGKRLWRRTRTWVAPGVKRILFGMLSWLGPAKSNFILFTK